MILSLNLSLPAIAILSAGRTEALQLPSGFTALTGRDGRPLAEGGTPVMLIERKAASGKSS